MKEPLVSIAVITYNSEKTVIETLDSIKEQTYQQIELIVSDDCSKDDTIALCNKWIKRNQQRFVRTKVVEVARNTGISANFNRADVACHGEWVKPIAGDDVLTPNCIEDCVRYTVEHTDAKCIFGNIVAFGGNEEYCKWLTETHAKRNVEMSKMSHNELYSMILKGETPPAPAFFYNRNEFRRLNISNDERIPYIEDWPKWLQILDKGLDFHFLNKYIVKYRIGGISTSSDWESERVYRSKRLVFYFYQFPKLYSKNVDETIYKIVDGECEIYRKYIETSQKLKEIKNSKRYRLGSMLISPMKKFKKLWKKINH
jgi:alpha-1,3-rhamnosyltransferase